MIISPLGRWNTLFDRIGSDGTQKPSESFLQWLTDMQKAGNTTLQNIPNGVLGTTFKNLIVDGGFNIWDGVRSGAFTAATGYTGCTMWSYSAGAGFANYSVQRIAGGAALNTAWRLRYQRTAASADVGTQTLYQDVESPNCAFALNSKVVTLSFYARVGDAWSPTGRILTASIQTGTGTDQAARTAAYTGSVITSKNFVIQNDSYAVRNKYSMSVLVPANATQVGIQFSWTPTGVASANDYVDLEQVQLEQSSYPTQFEVLPFGVTYMLTRRHFNKSFKYDIAPAQNCGDGSGGARYLVTNAGVVNAGIQVAYPSPMRAPPTITPFNPLAANGNWRNNTLGVDSGLHVGGGQLDSVRMNNPQVAGDLVGNALTVHWTADARI